MTPKPTVLDADTYRVLRYCFRWGVRVVFGALPVNARFFNTRGLFAIHRGTIWRDPRRSQFNSTQEEPHDLLHELSHVLDGEPPIHADEQGGPMLALDYYGSRWLRLPGRMDWVKNFGVDHPKLRSGHATEWREISAAEKHMLLQESLKRAVRRGLLTEAGKPTFRR